MSAVAVPSALPSLMRAQPSRSRVGSVTPGGVLVPASITGESDRSRKSSVVLGLGEAPQFASTLKAAEVAARAGVKVRTLVVLLMAVMVRATPSLLYSSFWLVR